MAISQTSVLFQGILRFIFLYSFILLLPLCSSRITTHSISLLFLFYTGFIHTVSSSLFIIHPNYLMFIFVNNFIFACEPFTVNLNTLHTFSFAYLFILTITFSCILLPHYLSFLHFAGVRVQAGCGNVWDQGDQWCGGG